MPLNIPLLDADETKALLAGVSPQQLLDGLRTAFAGLVTGTSVQPMTAITDFPDGAGDCVFLSGLQWDLGLLGVKVSPLVKARTEQGLNPVTAYTFVLSASTGEPVLLCDSMALTAARTGATTALGVGYLASPDARRLAVLGSGPVALETIRHVAELRDWESVRVYSPALLDETSERRRDFERRRPELESLLGASIDISADVAADADVVLCCTSASAPIIPVARVKEGALVTSVTSDIHPAHEIAPGDLPSYDVYCDYRFTCTAKSYEMKQAVAENIWSMDDIIADLPELTTSEPNIDFSKRRYFRNHGVAIEDLVVANLILPK